MQCGYPGNDRSAGARTPSPTAAEPVAFTSLVAAGFVAAILLTLSPPEEAEATNVEGSETCTEAESSVTLTGAGGHPPKDFYTPEEEAPGIDLVHVIGDGFVVVRYQPSLPAADIETLRQWVQKDDKAVVGAADPDQTVPIRAVTARRELACSQLEVETLTAFRDSRFASEEFQAG